MSLCPLPNTSGATTEPTGTLTTPTPVNVNEDCNVTGTNIVTGSGDDTVTEVICTGPPGPQGIQGIQGDCGLGYDWEGSWVDTTGYYSQSDVCNASTVENNGIAYVCILTHTADGVVDEPGVGADWELYWDLFVESAGGGGSGNVNWRGNWVTTTQYEIDDFVTNNASSYMCIVAHFSTDDTEPNEQDDYEGGENWHLVSTGLEDYLTWTDTFDNFFDHITDIDEWGWGDWLQAIAFLALGAGVVWAGISLLNAFDSDGSDNGTGEQADQRFTSFNGSDGYNGAFTQPLLPNVVAELCQLAGIGYDVSELPNEIVNSSFAQITTINSIIEQLALIYQFDRVESGSIIKFIPKDKSPVKELVSSDLGYSKDSVGESHFTFKRFQGIDLPRAVKITYLSELNSYNKFTQETRFQNFTDGNDVNLSVSMSLDDAKAKSITEIILKNAHLEQMNYGFTTSYDQIELESGDVVITPEGNMRITRIVETDEGLINFLCTDASNNDTTYTVSDSTVSIPAPQTNVPVTVGFSDAFFMDLPALNSNDDDYRLYAAVHGYGQPDWAGASIYKSINNGSSYTLLAATEAESTWGKVVIPTPTIAPWQTFDDVNVITVELKTGTLASVADIDLFNDVNRCMIGSEIIAFGTATLIAANTYELSHLLRGRQGTDFAIGGHVADEPFILINDALLRIPYEAGDRGKPALYKVVSAGSSLDVTTSATITPYGINFVPWTQMNPEGVKQPNNDWEITWIDRYKFGGDGLDDYTEVVKDEDWSGWTVVILDGAVEKKIINVQKASYTYKVADQLADWGVVQNTITVKIFGRSKIVGGGYSLEYTF
ncbi:MAG: hypothetical protein DRH08_06140 [Deltaproteobacteria bacterium]|nr:MAG: hypothetical protein DRH08_06140 [Deltaproteobacteria bacterium]